MDPVALIVESLAIGAAAALKDTAAEAIKDAYAGLKLLIVGRCPFVSPSIAELESTPHSEAPRAILEGELTRAHAPKDLEILKNARDVLEKTLEHDPDVARVTGLDLHELYRALSRLTDPGADGANIGGAAPASDEEFADR